LPPLNTNSASADAERQLALEVYEQSVFLSILSKDKQAFQRNISTIRSFYSSGYGQGSANYSVMLGLNLLYLLVENKLSDFHCELELLSEEQRAHTHVSFCTQLDQHLTVGSYDQVMSAAAHPPVPFYSFFLKSLLETVRVNIAECAAASYSKFSLQGATEILMFANDKDTLAFITAQYPDWAVNASEIDLRAAKKARSEELSAHRLITQTLGYATELERIV
jgi:26S proteasome regulatory subunit N12